MLPFLCFSLKQYFILKVKYQTEKFFVYQREKKYQDMTSLLSCELRKRLIKNTNNNDFLINNTEISIINNWEISKINKIKKNHYEVFVLINSNSELIKLQLVKMNDVYLINYFEYINSNKLKPFSK